MRRRLTALSASLLISSVAVPTFAAPADPAPPPADQSGPPTLLGKKVAFGGYGGVDVAYTRMFGRDGALIGLQGAVLLGHRLHLGLAGYGWTNPESGPDDIYGRSRSYQMGYVGGTLRYSFLERAPVFVTVGGLVGVGGIVLAPDDTDRRDRDDDDDIDREDVDLFPVFQPEVALHANVTRWMRLGVTGGYRFAVAVNRFGYSESDVNGAVIGGQIQFGRF